MYVQYRYITLSSCHVVSSITSNSVSWTKRTCHLTFFDFLFRYDSIIINYICNLFHCETVRRCFGWNVDINAILSRAIWCGFSFLNSNLTSFLSSHPHGHCKWRQLLPWQVSNSLCNLIIYILHMHRYCPAKINK